MPYRFASALLLTLVACSSSSGTAPSDDAGSPQQDASLGLDGSLPDGASSDAGASFDGAAPIDSAPADAACSSDLTTDPHNCGVCGHDCAGATCSASLCAPTTMTQPDGGRLDVGGFAVDGTGVYWSDPNSQALWTLPKSGGVALVAQASANAIEAFAGALYWKTGAAGSSSGLAILSVPTTGRGATPSVVVNDSAFPSSPLADDTLAYSAGYLYTGDLGSIWSVPLPSGDLTPVFGNTASDTGNLVFDPSGTWLFQPFTYTGGIARVTFGAADAGPVVDYPTGAVHPSDLQVDAQNLYWIEGGQSIQSWPFAGGTATTIASTLPGVTATSPYMGPMIVSGGSLFVAGPGPGAASALVALYEIPLDGRAPFLLALPHNGLRSGLFAADATSVYFDTVDTGLSRVAR